MARLVLMVDGMTLKDIPLDRERLTIGRKPHNQLRIDHPAVSGEHAVVVTLLGDSFLEDLDSTNGTRVNGQRVHRHALQSGDVIEIGRYRLRYETGAALPAAEPPPASVQVIDGPAAGRHLRLGKPLTTLGKAGDAVAVIARHATGYYLQHVEGERRPRVNDEELNERPRRLNDQDCIELAGVRMIFNAQDNA